MNRFTGNIASLTVLGIILSIVSGCSNSSAQQKQRQYVNQDADYARQVINLGPGINEACTCRRHSFANSAVRRRQNTRMSVC